MKTFFNALMLLQIGCFSLSSQTLNTSIHTPNGSQVGDTYNRSETQSIFDKINISQYIISNYPQASEVNTHSSTTQYNCHAYAWYMYEGGSQKYGWDILLQPLKI